MGRREKELTLRSSGILVLVLTTFVGTGASTGGTLPDRLYLDDRPDVAWVSLEAAIASGPVSTWGAWGAFAPNHVVSSIEQRKLWPQQRLSLRDNPQFEELDRRMSRTRDEHGNCTRALTVGGSRRRFASASEFVESHNRVVVGTIESRTPGFMYGHPVTVYGLRIDTVLAGAKRPALRPGSTVFIPHGDFDASIEGMDVCYWAQSRPAVPMTGLRAAVGFGKRPRVLRASTGGSGRRYLFAGSWVTSSLWFETGDGSAWTTAAAESRRWDRVERDLANAAQREPAAGGERNSEHFENPVSTEFESGEPQRRS